MADEVKVPASLIDRLAALLVFLQQDDPSQLVFRLGALKQEARALQAELRLLLRGHYVVCHLCQPPIRILVEEVERHDQETHGVRRTPCFTPDPTGKLKCGQPKGHTGNHNSGYSYWSQT